MDSLSRDENLERFVGPLRIAADPDRREELRRRLIAEEDRYGSRAERLQVAERRIAEAKARILHHEGLKTLPLRDHRTISMLDRVIGFEREILAVFEDYRRALLDGLDRADV